MQFLERAGHEGLVVACHLMQLLERGDEDGLLDVEGVVFSGLMAMTITSHGT